MDTKTVVHGNDIRHKLSSRSRPLKSPKPLMTVMHLLKRIEPQTNRTNAGCPNRTSCDHFIHVDVKLLSIAPRENPNSIIMTLFFQLRRELKIPSFWTPRSALSDITHNDPVQTEHLSDSPQDIQTHSCNKPETLYGEVIGEDLVPESPNTGAKQKIL